MPAGAKAAHGATLSERVSSAAQRPTWASRGPPPRQLVDEQFNLYVTID